MACDINEPKNIANNSIHEKSSFQLQNLPTFNNINHHNVLHGAELHNNNGALLSSPSFYILIS